MWGVLKAGSGLGGQERQGKDGDYDFEPGNFCLEFCREIWGNLRGTREESPLRRPRFLPNCYPTTVLQPNVVLLAKCRPLAICSHFSQMPRSVAALETQTQNKLLSFNHQGLCGKMHISEPLRRAGNRGK